MNWFAFSLGLLVGVGLSTAVIMALLAFPSQSTARGRAQHSDDMPTNLRAALDATSRGWFRTTEDAPSERSRMLAINSALAVTLAVECPWLRPGHADAERLLMHMAAAAVEAYHWPERPAP